MAAGRAIQFLSDQNVPDSVGAFLVAAGHDLIRIRDVMPIDSPDPIVAEAAIRAERVLVSWDRDFHQQRFMRPRFARLSRIGFSCPEPEGAARLGAVIDIVEFVINRAKGAPVTIRIARDKVQLSC